MKRISRLTTAVGAFTLGMGLLGTTFAMAEPPAAPTQPQPAATVTPDTPVSFTIVKYSGPEVTTGARPDSQNNKPLKDIKFTVTRIDYQGTAGEPKIGTGAWWEWAYSQKADGTLKDAVKSAHSFDLVTDDKGQACLSGTGGMTVTKDVADKVKAGTTCTQNAEVKQGLYLVEETGTTSGGKNYRGALPFFITLPLAEGADTATANWNYDPIIEPKNQEFSMEKQLTDAGGNKAVYTVTSSIPSSGLEDTNTTKYDVKYPFGIEDIYPDALSPLKDDVVVYVKGNKKEKEALTKDSDFKAALTADDATKVDPDVWENAVVESAKTFAVYFTKDGAAKLAAAVKDDPTAKVYFDMPFKVVDQSAKITNKVVPHDAGSKKVPSGREVTNEDAQFINLKITKVDAENNATKLEGAVFNFYKCTEDTNGNLKAIGDALPGFAANTGFNNIENVTYDFSTAAETGEVTAYHVLNAAKVIQKQNDVPSTTKYVMCAVEKTAPTGYKKNPYPIKVQTATTADGAEVAQNITNTKTTFFDRLPKTGAAGIVLLLVLGGAMVIAGAAMRRRSGEEA